MFNHALWHAGEKVTAGVKHIMRSDVLYKPREPQAKPLEVPANRASA